MAFGKVTFPYSKTENKDSNQNNLKSGVPASFTEKPTDFLNYLPKFYIWLNEQINVGNRQFILGEIQSTSDQEKKHPQKKLIFLLKELLEQYSVCSKIAACTIQQALKEACAINHIYTVESDNQIIEVFPCLYPPF